MSYASSTVYCLLSIRFSDSFETVLAKFIPGGDSHMEQTGMLVGNFEFNP